MDEITKWLLTAACVVVIAGGGYFTVQEFRASARQAEIAEYRALKDRCDALFVLRPPSLMPDSEKALLTNCLLQGVATEAELHARLQKLKDAR